MAKAKKKPPITGNLVDTYIVEKSRPLMLMKEVPFELGELKVLDTYLSRINARDPEATTVRFSKEEYETLMGIERMRPERLGKYVDSLMGKTITVPDKDSRGGWRKYTLFDYSECSQDDDGQWWIDLSCTSKAKSLFFNIDGVGYIRYQLKNVLPLTSKYSVLLYLYLLDNRFRSRWETPVEYLRFSVFRCVDPLYEEFKYLNQRILKKAMSEINEKTDLTFEYEPVKNGRRVAAIKWTLIKDDTAPQEVPCQLSMDDPDLVIPEDIKEREALGLLSDEDERILFFMQALPAGLTEAEVEELVNLALPHVPYDPENPVPRDTRIRDYLHSQALAVKSWSARKKETIQHIHSVMKRAVAEDWAKAGEV